MLSWDPHSVRVRESEVRPVLEASSRPSRFAAAAQDNKLYCLMLTMIILCAAGVLTAVIVAGVIYANQM